MALYVQRTYRIDCEGCGADDVQDFDEMSWSEGDGGGLFLSEGWTAPEAQADKEGRFDFEALEMTAVLCPGCSGNYELVDGEIPRDENLELIPAAELHLYEQFDEDHWHLVD
jgi:hypothetical protein